MIAGLGGFTQTREEYAEFLSQFLIHFPDSSNLHLSLEHLEILPLKTARELLRLLDRSRDAILEARKKKS